MNVFDIMRRRKTWIDNMQRSIKLSRDNIDKIKDHPLTSGILVNGHKAAFNYICKNFSDIDIKDVGVYKCSNSLLEALGYRGIGGFFSLICKIIVIPDKLSISFTDDGSMKVHAKITEDEVLVHELLHYISDARGTASKSMHIEEEFAYGNSVMYLKEKGHSDEAIIHNIFMPYLMGTVNWRKLYIQALSKMDIGVDEFLSFSEKDSKEIFESVKGFAYNKGKEEAYNKGKEIISIYSKVRSCDDVVIKKNRFDMMDI